MGATRRLFHFADAFKKLGFNVVLLAGKRTNSRLQTCIDRLFPGIVIRTHHTGAYPRILDMAPLLRRAWRSYWKVRGAEYYATRLSYGWADALDISQVISELKNNGLIPNIIYGISGGYLDGLKGADQLSQVLNVPWIIELHDPPWWCGLGKTRAPICEEFRRLLKSSTGQIVTSDSYRKHLIEEFDLAPERVWTIYGCFDDEIQVNSIKTTLWRIVYAGSLEVGRSLAPLLLGYYQALEREPGLKNSSSIEIAGKGPGFSEVDDLSKKLAIDVRIHGNLSKQNADELVKMADILVVIQTKETCRFQIPGKVFEYMASGKPILAIMDKCEAADILRRSGLGFVHSQEDIDGISDTLAKLWNDWRTGRSSVKMNYDYVSQFSSKCLPDKLKPILEALLPA
ncbi:MAG: glycosyltransferase [Candidatus Omnitrophica bacterium]|nr:glycosyltransferase [Candidatus Omnitrophota bacterium]